MARPIYKADATAFLKVLRSATDFANLPALAGTAFLETLDEAFALPALAEKDRRVVFDALTRWAVAGLKPGDRTVVPSRPPPGEWGRDVREFTAAQCRNILANALLGNVADPISEIRGVRDGGLNFKHLNAEKLAALLLYFNARLRLEQGADDQRVVRFEHIRGPSDASLVKLLETSAETVLGADSERALVRLHDERMEKVEADAFVNFANRRFGYGQFIDSCTQEEILQMCCPEFNVGMLAIGIMEDDEVVVVRRCRRYVAYTGYLNTFAVAGPVDGPIQDILTIDACTSEHFSREMVLRDVRKAYTAFKCLADESTNAGSPPVVSTGRWGCGIFGGTVAHKFIQQLIAARMANVSLEFSIFGRPEGCDQLLSTLQQHHCTVADIWRLLCECTDQHFFLPDACKCIASCTAPHK